MMDPPKLPDGIAVVIRIDNIDHAFSPDKARFIYACLKMLFEGPVQLRPQKDQP
jgi:hypothetical protein